MNTKSTFKALAALAVIVAIGFGLGWLASHRRRAESPVVVPATESAAATASSPIAMRPVPEDTNQPQQVAVSDAMEEAEGKPWDEKISDILGDDTEITNKVVELLQLYPKLPPEGKLEAVGHL